VRRQCAGTPGSNRVGSFSVIDYVVIAVYLVATVFIGLRFTKRQENVEDYFVAGRAAPSWAVAISAIATGLSAISYLGVPAWVYKNDLQLNVAILLLPFAAWLVAVLFVPLLARLRLMTIYEYLERRFNLAVRTFASGLFLVLRGGWLAVGILTQSLLLAALSGMPLWVCIGITGVLTAVYTVFGGMEAVLWTDVMQFFVSISGLIVMIVVVLISFNGDVGQVLHISHDAGRTKMFDTTWSLTQISLWGIIVFQLVDNLATYGSDQVMVQRFLTSPSPKAMRRSVMMTGFMTIPVVGLLVSVGLCLGAYYDHHPELAAGLKSANEIVPHFVAHVLPRGVAGLVIAAVIAETMSTLSGGFNSLATATVVDFIQRFRKSKPINPRSDLLMARWVTLSWATASTITAVLLGLSKADKQIVETFLSISSLFTGPILGVFLLGLLTRRPGGAAALTGLIVGTATVWCVSSLTPVIWLWYAPIGFLTTFLVGYATGLVLPAQRKDIDALFASGPRGFDVVPSQVPTT
jgi:SSS family transporter